MQCTADTADTDTNIITVSWTRSRPQGGSTSDDFLTCYDAVLIILTATDQKQLPRQMSASRMEPGAGTRDPDQ